MRRSVILTLAVATSLLAPVSAPALADSVTSSGSESGAAPAGPELAATLVPNGSGLISAASYLAPIEIAETVTQDDYLPLVQIATPTEVWGPDAGHVAGWIEPADLRLSMYSDRRQGPITLDAAGLIGPGTLQPGDRVEFGVMELVRNYYAPLDAPRGATGGHLDWEVTQDEIPLAASLGGVEADAVLTAVRADLVVRGGDIDARANALATPTLAIPLPAGYPIDTAYSAALMVAAPAASYIGNLDIVIDPVGRRALIDTEVEGWLPQTIDFTTATGKRLSTWRLPMQIALVADPDAGAATTAVAAIQAGAPSEVVAVSGGKAWRGSLAAGTTVMVDAADGARLMAPDGSLSSGGSLAGLGSLASAPLPEVDLAALPTTGATDLSDLAGPAPTGRETAAWVAAADLVIGGPPITATFGDGAGTLTIDPDRDGRLVLTDWADQHGRPLADLVAPDGVEVDGVRLPLDNLVELHAWPMTSSIEIGFLSGVTGEDDATIGRRYNVATVYLDAALDLHATWLLADGSTARLALLLQGPDVLDDRMPPRAFLTVEPRPASGSSGASGGGPGAPRVTVQPPVGPVAIDDGTAVSPLDREALVPAYGYDRTVRVGALSLSASAGADGVAAVTRRDASVEGELIARPRPLRDDGATIRVGPPSGTGTGSLGLQFASSPLEVPPAPPPFGTGECGPAEATDPAGDGVGGLDVVEVRIDDDRDWIWITIDHASEIGVPQLGARWRETLSLHQDNFPYIVTIEVDETGQVTANRGFGVEVDGSRLRLSAPREELGLDDGEVIRDVGVVSSTILQGRMTTVDQAPDGSGSFGTGSGMHVAGAC